MLCTLATAVLAAALHVSDISSITIQTSVSGLGGGSQYRQTMERDAGGFIGNGFTPDGDVQPLVDALNRPNDSAIPLDRMGFDRPTLEEYLPNARAYLGAAVSLPGARTAFDSHFLNARALETWIFRTAYAGKWHEEHDRKNGNTSVYYASGAVSDYYPSATITISTRAGNVTISSSSQRPFMLPLDVIDRGRERESWDPGLARAIAALMPNDAALRDALSASSVPFQWADAIANGKTVSLAIAREAVGVQRAKSIARAAGFVLEYDVEANPRTWRSVEDFPAMAGVTPYADGLPSAASWSGWVAQPGIPNARYTMGGVRSSVIAFKMLLAQPQAAFDMLRHAKWLLAALAANPRASIGMELTDPSDYVKTLETLGKNELARALQSSARTVLLTMHDPNGAQSRWYLLDDGEMVLLDFQDGMAFPFNAQWYGVQPRLMKDGRFGNAGVLLDAQGHVKLQAGAPPD